MATRTTFVATGYPPLKMNSPWFNLIGDPKKFSLESRIFHSISIGLVLLACFYVPYNFFAGLYVGSVSAALLASLFCYQYYNSRYCGKEHSNLLFGLTGIVLFSINYFTNSGIVGSTDLIWPAYLLLVFAISPYKQHLSWLALYIIAFMCVHLLEFYFPDLVQHPFDTGRGQFTDRITAFPLPVISIYVVIKYIRQSYDKERLAVETKAAAVEVRNQQIMQQKLELEQSNAEKNKLMSIISHDLRAPLINIQNYLELLKESGLDSDMRPELENDLLKATNNTMDMLSNLLHWSKSQMEGPSVRLVNIDLHRAIKSTLEMGRVQAAKKDITLTYHIAGRITVVADVDMLQLVVRNLISNATKFTGEGGDIHVDARTENGECNITVTDNGKGIDARKQPFIFSAKAQPAFGTNHEKGVGLGLLLCKEFIERQHGTIGFESVAGHGSSFYVTIPAKV